MTKKLQMPKEVRQVCEFNYDLTLEHDGTEVFIGLTRQQSEEYLELKLASLDPHYSFDEVREKRRMELLDKINAARNVLILERLRDRS